MTRAITSGELASLRAGGQHSELYLAIHKPAAVFAARVNQTFSTADEVTQITFDTVTTGAYTAALAGMTCYVGSSAGAYDLGMVRVRKAPTATVLYIGATSEIAWVDDLYLTVVNEFGLWAKHWRVVNETEVYMDWDVAYSDQNTNLSPLPTLGPDAVLWLTGTTVAFTPTAGGGASYVWTAPGASETSNLTTASPTITYIAAGTYQVGCTATAANGKTTLAHRTVFVYSSGNMPITAFTLENCSGNADDGGWSFSVSLTDQAAIADVRERAKVILFARDKYNTSTVSIGPITGYENIIATGWIDDESIDWDAEQGGVTFAVRGPAYWLSRLSVYPIGLKNTASAPTNWGYSANLTVDTALNNLVYWRSTIAEIMDCCLTGDVRIAAELTSSQGNILSQIKEIAGRILAEPRCDRFGRMYIEIDTQYLPAAGRSGIPIVQAITATDWMGKINIPRKPTPDLARLETGGTDENGAYYARSYGIIPGIYGGVETKDNMIVDGQSDLNMITGHIVARRNNPFPSVNISLSANNRMIDICPRQYLTISIAAGDTERGIVWNNQKLIPRKIEISHSIDTGWLQTDLDCEAETSGAPGVTMNPPAIGTENPSPVIHIPPVKWDPFQSPYINNHPPVVPLPGVPLVPPGLCTDVANGPFAATANGSISNSRKKSIYILGCGQFSTARPSSFSNQTVLVLQCDFQTLTAGTWITDSAGAFAEAYLLDEFGARLFQGTWTGTGTQRTITFAPPAATRFSGVEICLDAYSVFNVTNVTTAYDRGQGAFGSSHLTHHDTVWSVGADGGLHLHVDAGFQVDDPGGGYTTFLRTYTTITAPDILPYVPTNYDVFGNMTLFASDDDYFATYHAFQSWKTGVVDSVSPVGQWKNYLGQLVTVMNGPLDPATQSPAYRMRTAPRAGDLTINYPNPYEVWLFGSQLQITAMMWNPGAWLATWRYLLDYVIYGQANKRLIVNSGQFYNLCP